MSTRTIRGLGALLCGVLTVTTMTGISLGGAAPAAAAPGTDAAAPILHDRVVSEVPAAGTPQVRDGRVLTIAQVGTSIVAGGNFTQVSPSGGNPVSARRNIFAFNAASNAISTGFAPTVNADVNIVFPGPVVGSVYVGGGFTTINGQSARLALLDVTSGQTVNSFDAPTINGAVEDVVKLGNRLYVAGTFTNVGGVAHRGLATLNATTGALDNFMGVDVLENHNFGINGTARAAVGVTNIAISPNGQRLAAIGNFRTADGLPRDQAVLIDISGGSAQVLSNWRTRRYEAACAANAFDTYVRDIDFSPDGTYFVIVATGGPNPGTLCDTIARWATNATGDAVEPQWIDDTGGDTLLSVASTGAAIYNGGHQRWMNNAGGRDRPAPGAVPRPGMSAIDPRSGVALSWNPGRQPRGVGAFVMQPTATGLWVGSDTEYIGNGRNANDRYFRSRLAFFPLAGGTVIGPGNNGSLPSDVYLGSPGAGTGGSTTLDRRFYSGTGAPGPRVNAPTGGLNWSTVRAATLIDGELFYGTTAGTFFRRTFDGTTYGPARQIDPYNDPRWSTVDTGSGQTYRGLPPPLYAQLATTTGLAFEGGRLYSTRAGVLSTRGFSPQSGIISGVSRTVASIANIGGIFFSGGRLWYVTTNNGNLSRVNWVNGAPSGPATVVSGPGIDGVDWRADTLFLGPDGAPATPNSPPSAVIAAPACTGTTCSFDGSGSNDSDGSVTAHIWEFGDGATASGARITHTFPGLGTYTVRLTVTDDDGATGTVTRQVTVTTTGPAAISFLASAQARATATAVNLAIPAAVAPGDSLLLFVTPNSAATGRVGDPAGQTGGWLREATRVSSTMQTVLFSRVATAGDAGDTVTVPLTAQAKVDVELVAYRGTSVSDPTRGVASRTNGSVTAHPTPAAAAQAGDWAVSYWADKSDTTTAWTPPGAVTPRADQYGTGTGRVSSLVADAGGPVAAGSYGDLTATVNATSARGTAFTVVLAPAS